jgi:hypothetical protein
MLSFAIEIITVKSYIYNYKLSNVKSMVKLSSSCILPCEVQFMQIGSDFFNFTSTSINK